MVFRGRVFYLALFGSKSYNLGPYYLTKKATILSIKILYLAHKVTLLSSRLLFGIILFNLALVCLLMFSTSSLLNSAKGLLIAKSFFKLAWVSLLKFTSNLFCWLSSSCIQIYYTVSRWLRLLLFAKIFGKLGAIIALDTTSLFGMM